MSDLVQIGEREPPPIPAASLRSAESPARPLLIWVRTGTAQVRTDDSTAFDLAAGEGIWLPAGCGSRREVVTEPGSVAFPLWPHTDIGDVTEPTRFEIPEGWQDWLIQQYNLQSTPFSNRGYSHDSIADLLQRSAPQFPAPAPVLNEGASVPLALPKARGARSVAEELLRDPALTSRSNNGRAECCRAPALCVETSSPTPGSPSKDGDCMLV